MDPIISTGLARIQTDPVGSDPIATAFFSTTTTIDGKAFEAPWESVSWRLQDTDLKVTIDDLELSAAQISAFVTALAYAVKAEQDAPPVVEEPVADEPVAEEPVFSFAVIKGVAA